VECKKVLKNDEQNVSAMFVLANVYTKQGRTELAMMVLDNAGHIDPNRAELPNLQGVILLAQKKKSQALEKFRAAAALRVDYPEPTTTWARCCSRRRTSRTPPRSWRRRSPSRPTSPRRT